MAAIKPFESKESYLQFLCDTQSGQSLLVHAVREYYTVIFETTSWKEAIYENWISNI